MPGYFSVKEAIFPFAKFQGVDPILGPEMRSTGEVMGVGRSFGAAFARAEEAASIKAPATGKAFISVRDPDKPRVLPVAQDLVRRGYTLVATRGTATFLREQGLACEQINKVIEGRPHIVDLIKNGEIVYIVNTTEGRQAIADSFSIRREALQQRVTYSTTIAGAKALLHSLDYRDSGPVWSLQELHKELEARHESAIDREGRPAPARGTGRTEVGEAAGGDRRDRRGARARRSQGERRVPRRARPAELHRRPHQAAGSRAVATRRSSTWRRSTPARRSCSARPSTLPTPRPTKRRRYQIVGDLEADIKQGLIAISSPVARALIGKHEGDVDHHRRAGRAARVRDRRRPLRSLRRPVLATATLLLPASDRVPAGRCRAALATALGRADRLPAGEAGRARAAAAAFRAAAARLAGRGADAAVAMSATRARRHGCAPIRPGCGPTSTARACSPAATCLQLTQDDVDALLPALRPLFGDAGFALDAPAPSRWYLRLPPGCADCRRSPIRTTRSARTCSTICPSGADGRAIARRWRALLSEAQVVLHNHPWNAQRAAPGKPPINSLWFWGGGVLPDSRRSDAHARVAADDSLLRALATSAKAEASRLAGRDSRSRDADVLVDLRGSATCRSCTTRWLAPAIDAMRHRRSGGPAAGLPRRRAVCGSRVDSAGASGASRRRFARREAQANDDQDHPPP